MIDRSLYDALFTPLVRLQGQCKNVAQKYESMYIIDRPPFKNYPPLAVTLPSLGCDGDPRTPVGRIPGKF